MNAFLIILMLLVLPVVALSCGLVRHARGRLAGVRGGPPIHYSHYPTIGIYDLIGSEGAWSSLDDHQLTRLLTEAAPPATTATLDELTSH